MSERAFTTVTAASIVSTFGTNCKMMIVDCRDADYNDGGHIKTAINIPSSKLVGNNIEKLVNDCAKDGVSNLIFYCQYGQQRSVKAANAANRYINELENKPLLQISYLQGGFQEFYRKYHGTENVEK